ncbi:MAG: outer membrane protein transport protein [Bacteroidales bacterium]|nr:outer membrane protein transport protein [Bacteroidales bacterium]
MKKRILLVSFILISVFYSKVNAQMDNLANMSSEWIRMNNRNASLDAADIVNYNPAGLTFLNPGLHINISNQTLIRQPKHTYDLGLGEGEKTFEQDGIDAFLPMFYATYVKEKWAVYSGVYIAGGGATVNYPDGSISTDIITKQILYTTAAPAPFPVGTTLNDIYGANEQSLEASSYYLTIPLGFSYKINDVFSVSAGGRYIKGTNKTKASLSLTDSPFGAPDQSINIDYSAEANGFGYVLGLNVALNKKINIAAHYESKVKLDFENDVKTDDTGMFTDGKKNRRDLPAVINTGISYKITDKLRTEINYNYYFQTKADWGKTYEGTPLEVETSEIAGDCYTLGLGFAYDMNEKLQLSIGSSYTHFGYENDEDKEVYYSNLGWYEALKNSNLNIGLGGAYEVVNNLKLNLGFAMTFWKDYDTSSKNAEMLQLGGVPITNTNVKCEDKAYVISIGLNYTF